MYPNKVEALIPDRYCRAKEVRVIVEKILSNRPCQNVLIVEDCLISLKHISTTLDRFGCDVALAFEGREAVSMLLERQFDLVILGAFQPLSSIKVLRLADSLLEKADKARLVSKIPFVIYTENSDESSIPDFSHFEFLGYSLRNAEPVIKNKKSLQQVLSLM